MRDELEEVNVLASHYVDKAISDAYSVLRGWRGLKRGELH